MSGEISSGFEVSRLVFLCERIVLGASAEELKDDGRLMVEGDLKRTERYDIKIISGKNSASTFGGVSADEVRNYVQSNPHSDIYVSVVGKRK